MCSYRNRRKTTQKPPGVWNAEEATIMLAKIDDKDVSHHSTHSLLTHENKWVILNKNQTFYGLYAIQIIIEA